MSVNSIAFDKASLDLSGKALVDDDKLLGYPTVIASEMVQQYEDGWAYKSADALQKMALNAQLCISRPVKILDHPAADTGYLLMKPTDIYGYVNNFQFTKSLPDIKTGRPCRRGVKADVFWYKERVPSNVLDAITSGDMIDVSMGFPCLNVYESGEYEGQHYDYKQENIFLDHLAAPIPKGRCPGPVCGIGVGDAAYQSVKLDAQLLTSCPVCSHMSTVGWQEAGKRLYDAYGPDVIEVIDTGVLPVAAVNKTQLDADFNRIMSELKTNLEQRHV